MDPKERDLSKIKATIEGGCLVLSLKDGMRAELEERPLTRAEERRLIERVLYAREEG